DGTAPVPLFHASPLQRLPDDLEPGPGPRATRVPEVSGARPARHSVVVCGMVAADPYQGGASWAVLQYVLGLERLGCDVTLVEQWTRADGTVPATRTPSGFYFREVVRSFGIESRSALLLSGTDQTVGLSYPRLRKRCRGADLLINVSGIL